MAEEEKERRRGLSFEDAWEEYFEAHPETLAAWSHQNGYMPMGYRSEDLED